MRRRDRRLAKERAKAARREAEVAVAVLAGAPVASVDLRAEEVAEVDRVARRVAAGQRVPLARWERALAAAQSWRGFHRHAEHDVLRAVVADMARGATQDQVIADVAQRRREVAETLARLAAERTARGQYAHAYPRRAAALRAARKSKGV